MHRHASNRRLLWKASSVTVILSSGKFLQRLADKQTNVCLCCGQITKGRRHGRGVVAAKMVIAVGVASLNRGQKQLTASRTSVSWFCSGAYYPRRFNRNSKPPHEGYARICAWMRSIFWVGVFSPGKPSAVNDYFAVEWLWQRWRATQSEKYALLTHGILSGSAAVDGTIFKAQCELGMERLELIASRYSCGKCWGCTARSYSCVWSS